MQPLSITQAGLVSILTTVVGYLVAFVPDLAQWQSDIIAIGTTAISLVFLVANALHAHAIAKIAAVNGPQVAKINVPPQAPLR
jgi:multisubunit Na+/H+ antiporter MnhG subunit